MNKSYFIYHTMAHVIVLDSVNEDIFVCGLCKSIFNSLQIFLNHKTYKCSFGALEEKLLPTSTILETEILSESYPTDTTKLEKNKAISDTHQTPPTQTQDHLCQTCQKHFKNMRSLLAHMKIHNEKPFQCFICGRCFNQNSHLQRHISTHKVWPDGLTQTTAKTIEAELLSYSCTYCDVVLSSYGQYRAHLKTHVAFKRFKCIQNDCMEFYDSVESLLHHVNTEHETVKYACYICGRSFDSLEGIATHQDAHKKSGETMCKKIELFKCTQCDAEFRKAEKLALHMLTESHKKVCIHCTKTFASDKRLRLHLKIHTKFKLFQCNICNSSFPMKKYLSAHLLKHGARKYKCSVCKLSFKRSDLLQRHMRLHQTKKLYKCPFKDSLDCKKEFSRSDKLKTHIKSHTKYISMNASPKSKLLQSKSPPEINGETK